MGKRVLVVGANGGGMSCAARLRRLDESADVVLFDRGPFFSYAQCGLPYVLGREIPSADDLLVQHPDRLRETTRLDVRAGTEVVSLNLAGRTVRVRDVATGVESDERYDALVLSPGSVATKPPADGLDRPGHFFLRTVPDVQAVIRWLDAHTARTAVVVGGGYIGLEAAEQLQRRGLRVTLVQRGQQVFDALAPELAARLHLELRANGIDLRLNEQVERFDPPEQGSASTAVLEGGDRLPADVVVFGIGVKPDVELAKAAGLTIGEAGGIRVDGRQRTSDPHVWAVGDVVETRHLVTGKPTVVALAGPANRQGRVAADSIAGRASEYPGSLGTAVTRVFGLTAAFTGATEKELAEAGLTFQAVHVHAKHHAGYYPGAETLSLKLLFAPDTGRLLGAQAVGAEGADKRIDALSVALAAGMTVAEVAELELGYAPPFGAAKDPVNVAGMAAENVRAGLVRVAHWSELPRLLAAGAVVVDVREADEREKGFIPGSVSLPWSELRNRLDDVPRNRDLVVQCGSGQRSYKACRLLTQNGFACRNLSGGFTTYQAVRDGLPGGVGDA